MLTIALFFFLGIALGFIGLRLLAHWNDRPFARPHFHRLHRRH